MTFRTTASDLDFPPVRGCKNVYLQGEIVCGVIVKIPMRCWGSVTQHTHTYSTRRDKTLNKRSCRGLVVRKDTFCNSGRQCVMPWRICYIGWNLVSYMRMWREEVIFITVMKSHEPTKVDAFTASS